MLIPALLLAAASAGSIDGSKALEHASALAALGPRVWGSPRSRVAAQYAASAFRDAGLEEVRLAEFAAEGLSGANALGVLRAPGQPFVLIAAHHDTAPGSPGAYDDGGGVGVLVEVARVLAANRDRPRQTLVFASFDGEEAWSTGKTTAAGARAWLKSQGADLKHLQAAIVIEMSGQKDGVPVLHPIAYPDPLRPGGSRIAPGWLVSAALRGSAAAGQPLGLGDVWLSWLYQPAVRAFAVDFYGDDLALVQAGLPAVFVSDSSFTSFYPHYHQASDTADQLDPASLARMGQAVLGVVRTVAAERGGPGVEPNWFAAFGSVLGSGSLWGLATMCVLPGLWRAFSLGTLRLVVRGLCSAGFLFLFWRHPVPTLFALGPLLLALTRGPSRLTLLLGSLPALALAGFGAAAWSRGYLSGTWLTPLDWTLALGVALLALAPEGRSSRGGQSTSGGQGQRKGLPRKAGR